MTYEQAVHFAHTWGLVLAFIVFGGALAYALWPANRQSFDRAARAPLDLEDGNG